MRRGHLFPFGAQLRATGGTLFRLWAPAAEQVSLELRNVRDPRGEARREPMRALADGWHEWADDEAGAGTRYRYRLPDGTAVPDPASRFNPEDVQGASEVVDPMAYEWRDDAWCGRPWHEAVVYELHLGVFTEEGSFDAARARLPELAALGITAIELLPVADFPGRRNWGYDGVLPFAPDARYGRPEAMKAFVEAAHGLGMMVLLDVVYNHFGPEGNHLHRYAPAFFSPVHHTPWGASLNFDGEHSGAVRDFFRHNALYWVQEYHLDGLRLDAVHAIPDDSAQHIVCEIAQALREGPGRDRPLHLVLENERNEAHHLERQADGTPRCATAQWNDDLHHAAHVLLTGETDAYYADYAQAPVAQFARALAGGYVYQGQASAYRGGVAHGEPSRHLPGPAFVSFLQNHDQIGNRAFGQRLHELCDAPRLEAVYACLLLSPHIPMLFCGEEFAASSPFLFFCDFEPGLAQAVTAGRRAEFARFAAFRDEAVRDRIPDPNADETFARCKLPWHERELSPHRERLAFISGLLALRHRHLVPRLAGMTGGGEYRCNGQLIAVDWPLPDGSRWRLMANLGDEAATVEAWPEGELVYSHAVLSNNGRSLLAPSAVLVTCEAARV